MPHDSANTYRVSTDLNQAGKYEVRVEARYPASGWALRVYFQAGTAERVIARLLSALRYLQRHEEELWMWGSNASDRSLHFEELLAEAGLSLDRRREFPRAAVVLSVRSGANFRPLQVAELKRKLAGRLVPAPRTTRRPAEALRCSA